MVVNKLNRRFMVNGITIDPLKNLISSDTMSTEVSPRAIEILQLLVEKQGELVTYQEIEEKIWKGYNSHTSLYQHIASLRKALSDDPGSPTFIKTVSRRGYQFIGVFKPLDETSEEKQEKQQAVTEVAPKSRRLVVLGIAAVIAIIGVASLWGFLYLKSEEQNPKIAHYNQLTEALKQIGKPDTIIAIEIHQEKESVDNLPVLNTLAAITKHHLERKKEQHVVYIPAFKRASFYLRLEQHFSDYGKVRYVFKPVVTIEGNQITYGLSIISLADGSLTPFISLNAQDSIASKLPEFEKVLLEKLKSENLVDPNQGAILSENATANQYLIDAMDISFDRFNIEDRLDKSIENFKKSMANGQNNLIAYSALWDTGLLLMNQQTRYNVDDALVLMKEKSDIAQAEAPDYFKSYYAGAEYYCRIQDYDTCAQKLIKAISLKSFDQGTLGNLRFLLERINVSQTEVTRINYYLNPFSLHAASFYRNTLLSEQKFGEAIKLVNYHRHWEPNLYDWYLISQTKTRLEDLQELAKWYADHETWAQKAISQGKPSGELPSKYIGYLLLNANQTKYARYWSENGSEENLPYFDVKIIDLLADVWEGRWSSERWQVALDYANARKEFQNTLDKMYIAYFHFINGQESQAGQFLEMIFPELMEPNFVISRDNFRYVVYYNEVKKSIGDHRRVLYIEHQLRRFIESMPENQPRDVDFGLADAEFYALNNNKEKAMEILHKAIIEEEWLPNAFWLWVPIERNPFLKSLHGNPEFNALAAHVNKRLAVLCFEKECKQAP